MALACASIFENDWAHFIQASIEKAWTERSVETFCSKICRGANNFAKNIAGIFKAGVKTMLTEK